MILGCETYSVNSRFRENTITLEEIPALFRDLDITGISWNDLYFKSWDQAYFDKLNQATKDAGRRTMCLVMEGNLATADDAARKTQVELNATKMRAAKALNAPTVRINLGRAENEDEDGTKGVQRCIAAFNELLPLAKELDLKITIENHGGPSSKADWILEIIKGTDPAWVGSCLDFGNWPKDPSELKYKEIEKLAPYAYHTHVKSHEFGPDGEEVNVDHKRAFDIMKKAGYNGAVSIEWEGTNPADPVEGIKLSRDLIRKHWPEAK